METFKLKVKPLSVNKAWKGRRFKTPEYISYEWEVAVLLPKIKISGDVDILIEYHMNFAKLSDIDNPSKPLLDILVKQGLIDDDRKIWHLDQYKFQSDENFIYIEIKPYETRTSKSR